MRLQSQQFARIAFQILLIAALSAVFTITIGEFRSWINLFWILGPPLLVAVIFNNRASMRMIMAAVLITVSVVSASVTGIQVGLGP